MLDSSPSWVAMETKSFMALCGGAKEWKFQSSRCVRGYRCTMGFARVDYE